LKNNLKNYRHIYENAEMKAFFFFQSENRRVFKKTFAIHVNFITKDNLFYCK